MIMNTNPIQNSQHTTYTNLPEDIKLCGHLKKGDTEYTYEPKDPSDPTKAIRLTAATAYGKNVTPGYQNRHVHIKKESQLSLWVHGYKTLPSRKCIITKTDINTKKPEDVLGSSIVAAYTVGKNLERAGCLIPSTSNFYLPEGNFLCNEIVEKRYFPELAKSPAFGVKVNHRGEAEAFWDPNG